MSKKMLNVTPDASDLWAGIGGHFDSLTQILAEFVDNSVSNFESNPRTGQNVQISFKKLKDGYDVVLEDTGTGIENLEAVMRLGDKSQSVTPLNEHGFGLKHALASANEDNNRWRIITRTKSDLEGKKYRIVKAPYDFEIAAESVDVRKNPWPGYFNGTGTIVEFRCTEHMFDSLQVGIKGNAGFERSLDYLVEDLGFIYAGIIDRGVATINVTAVENGKSYNKAVGVIRPNWKGYYPGGTGEQMYDLGGGKVKINFAIGDVEESGYIKYYKKNQASQGLEIRINGRLMMSGLLKEIWGVEKHNSYNHFLGVINIESNDKKCLPKTRTSKNGIRLGDPKLQKLFQWIRSIHPQPEKRLSSAVSEGEILDKLAELKQKQIRKSSKRVEREFSVFKDLEAGVRIDLYVFDGDEVYYYEGKKDQADVQAVYQLAMYWDGLVFDGIEPSEGILIASSLSDGAKKMMDHFNKRKDSNGKHYNLSFKTWADEAVDYSP